MPLIGHCIINGHFVDMLLTPSRDDTQVKCQKPPEPSLRLDLPDDRSRDARFCYGLSAKLSKGKVLGLCLQSLSSLGCAIQLEHQ